MNKALLLLLLGAAACAKTQVDPTPSPAPKLIPRPASHTVSWQVDNRELNTGHWVSVLTPPATRRVYGREYVGSQLVSEVQLEFPTAVGTYTLGATSSAWARYSRAGVWYAAGAAPGTSAPAGSGTITLTTAQDGVAVGTFTFTGVDPVSMAEKTVTRGTFRVPF